MIRMRNAELKARLDTVRPVLYNPFFFLNTAHLNQDTTVGHGRNSRTGGQSLISSIVSPTAPVAGSAMLHRNDHRKTGVCKGSEETAGRY